MNTKMYTSKIEMVEVSPRDGLQNEATKIPTAAKLELIGRAIAAGSRRIEVTSFVNPRAVPQMADAEDVCAGLPLREDVTYIGLVMNMRGAERAIATGRIDQLGAVAVATARFVVEQQQIGEGTADIDAKPVTHQAVSLSRSCAGRGKPPALPTMAGSSLSITPASQRFVSISASRSIPVGIPSRSSM